MGTMEDQIRKIVREEIARALSAAGEVAANADTYDTDHIESVALGSITRTMERVARDVLANRHPEIPGHAVHEGEHGEDRACTACPHTAYAHRAGACFACSCPGWNASTLSTPSTEPVHTITAVPERPKATCTCHRHTHVMGHDDRCGSAFCYCLTPVRARPEHTASTDVPRTCSVCSHGEHDQGQCGMHVYLRGVASPCPCLASRTLGAQASTPPCSYCNHFHPGPLADCNVMVGKQLCPCPFTGGRS